MSGLSAKNTRKVKMKAKRKLDRTPRTRNQGNTAAVRKRLKKLAGKARAAKASVTAA